MATVIKESLGLLHEKIVVTVTPADYNASFENKLKGYVKTANLPGFRKGMVPIGLIKKMHGAGIFQEEVIKKIEEKLFDYLKSEQIEIFAQPLPLDLDVKTFDFNSPKDYNMSFEIGVKSTFDLNVSAINATLYNIDITDEMINEDIERLRNRYGTKLEHEVVEHEDNMLNVVFNETDSEGNIVEGGISKTNSLLVKYFKPTLSSALLGKKIGDSINVKIGDAFEDKEQEAILGDLGLDKENETNLAIHFNIEITQIGSIAKAEINEEFFAAAFPNKEVKTESEAREAIKAEIRIAFSSQEKNQLYDQLYHKLVDETKIDLPEAFLLRWLQVGGETKKTIEEATKEYPSFANSLKWSLITDKVCKENEIKVEQNDIKGYAKRQLMGYMNMSALDDSQPWIEDYAVRMMQDKKFVEESYYRIQSEKMFEAMEKKITTSTASITFEDFSKKLHNHH